MQTLGTALVNLVLRVDHVPQVARSAVVAVHIKRHRFNWAGGPAFLVQIGRGFRIFQIAALRQNSALPFPAFDAIHFQHTNAAALLIGPDLKARAVVIRLAVCAAIAVGRSDNVSSTGPALFRVVYVEPCDNAHIGGVAEVVAAAVRVPKQAVPRNVLQVRREAIAVLLDAHHNGTSAFDKQVSPSFAALVVPILGVRHIAQAIGHSLRCTVVLRIARERLGVFA